MKISDYKNEEALEVLANIIEPAAEILTDEKVSAVFKGKKFNKLEMVRYLLKNHSTAIVDIMAALNNKSRDEYEFNIISGTRELLDLMDDKELMDFFHSQALTMTGSSSGSVTEITTETEAE